MRGKNGHKNVTSELCECKHRVLNSPSHVINGQCKEALCRHLEFASLKQKQESDITKQSEIH